MAIPGTTELRLLLKRAVPFFQPDLRTVLATADPGAPFEARAEWLVQLCHWVLTSGRIPATYGRRSPVIPDSRPEPARTVRLRCLLGTLREDRRARARVATVIRSVLAESSALGLFAGTGLPGEHGFLSEALTRAMNRVLPRAPRARELSELLPRLFPSRSDALWLRRLPAGLFSEINELIRFEAPGSGILEVLFREDMLDATILLASNISTLGTAAEIRERLPEIPFRELPFVALLRSCEILVDRLAGGGSSDALSCLAQIDACREAIRSVQTHLEETGVSVFLVYRLEKMASQLGRLETLLGFLVPMEDPPGGDASPGASGVDDADGAETPDGPETGPGTGPEAGPDAAPLSGRNAQATLFLAELIRGGIADRSLRKLVQANLRKLARKVVERTGQGGEHYITRTREEYFRMFGQAVGGGLVAAVAAAIKFLIIGLRAPIFFDFLFNSINYSASFLLMQALHFKLATKQPSMTAATLAHRLSEGVDGSAGFDGFVDEVERITRSQLIAAIGNVAGAVPGAVALDLAWRRLTGSPFLDFRTAHHAISSLNPFTTLSVPFAALTGLILFLSSLAGGAVENWAVFNRLPEAIARNRTLVRMLGEEGARKLSERFMRHISGAAGCVALGTLLSAAPDLGRIFGLPLSAPHMTLSASALGLGAAAIPSTASLSAGLGPAALSIVLIGSINFGVSFALALAVAIRARDLDRGWVLSLLGGVGRRFLRSPRRFLFPDPASKPSAITLD